MKKVIYTKKAPEPIGSYNQAVCCGNMLFLSGQIPVDSATGTMIEGNIEDKTKQVLQNIDAILNEAGFTKKEVVKVSIFVKDIADFPHINKVYADYFTEEPPAREVLEAAKLPMNADLEISLIAMR